jgi:hypothetical protein
MDMDTNQTAVAATVLNTTVVANELPSIGS